MGYAVGIHSPERSLLSRLKTIGDFNQIAVGVTQINRADFPLAPVRVTGPSIISTPQPITHKTTSCSG